jgi:glutathione S-transferase
MADISAMVVVDFAGWIKITIPEDATNLRRWHAEVSARPSAAV